MKLVKRLIRQITFIIITTFTLIPYKVIAADIAVSTTVTTPQTFSLDNQKLLISAGGNLAVDTSTSNAAAVNDNNNAGSSIQLDSGNAAKGIIASGNKFGAVEITGTAKIGSIKLNSGIITSDKLAGATILLSGNGGATTITNASDSTISNSATSGIAINSSTTVNTQLIVNNAGTISVNNNANSTAINFNDVGGGSTLTINNTGLISAGSLGKAINVSDTGNTVTINNSGNGSIIGAITPNQNSTTITNSSPAGISGNITATTANLDVINNAGSITGDINLGNNSSSSLMINGGSVAGNVTMGNTAQILTLGNGSLAGKIDGAGKIIVSAPIYTLNGNIGSTTAVTSLVINSGSVLDATVNNNTIAVTTVSVSNGAFLNLGSTAVVGIIQGFLDGTGTVNLTDNYTLAGAMGTNSTRSLEAINVAAGKTLTAGGFNIDATTITLNADSSLILATGTTLGTIQGATDGVGKISITQNNTARGDMGTATNSLSNISIADGKTFSTNTYNIDAATISMGLGSSINLSTGKVTGLIQGTTDGVGTVSVLQDFITNSNIGSSDNSLATIAVAAGKTLDIATNNNSLDATTINLGSLSVLNVGTGSITGTVRGASNGVGTVNFKNDYTLTSNLGTSSNSLLAVNIADGKTLNTGAKTINATTISVGDGSILSLGVGVITGTIQGSADNKGTINFTDNNILGGNIGSATNSLLSMTIADGKTVTANTRNIDANNISLGSGSTLIMTTGSIVGVVDGATAGSGTVNLNSTKTIAAGNLLGSTNGLAAVKVGNGATITANESIKATNVIVGGGASGALSLGAGKAINGNVKIDLGATFTTNQDSTVSGTIEGVSDGVGTFSVAQNFTTTNDIGSPNNSLAKVTVAAGKTLDIATNNNSIDATTISIGSLSILNVGTGTVTGTIQGSSGSTGTVNFTNDNALHGALGSSTNSLFSVNITDGKTLTSGFSNINATTVTVGSGSTLSIGSGVVSGLIKGSADNVGTLNFNENYTLSSNIGNSTNSLFKVTVADGKTLSVNTRSIDANNILLGTDSNLILTTGAITGVIDGTTAGSGTVNLNSTKTITAGNFLGSTNGLAAVKIGNGAAITANESIKATNVIVGGGTSGTLSLGAGKAINGNVKIDLGSTFTTNLDSTVSGAIEGVSSGVGTFSVAQNFTTNGNIGGNNALSKITVAAGKTLDAAINNNSINATNLTLGSLSILNVGSGAVTGVVQGASNNVGTVNFNATTSISGSLGVVSNSLLAVNIADGKTLTSGFSNINATTVTVGSGSTLSIGSGVVSGLIKGSADNVGTVKFTDNNTLNGNLGNSTNSLLEVKIADGKNLNAVNYSIDANLVTVGSSANLILGNFQLTGSIKGSADGNGAVTFLNNYSLNGDVGSISNSLASATISSDQTLNVGSHTLDAGIIYMESGTTLNLASDSILRGAVDGTSSGFGTINFNGNNTLAAGTVLGLNNNLSLVNISNGSVITANDSIKSNDVKIGSGANLIMNNGKTVSGSINGASAGVGTYTIGSGSSTISNDIGTINGLENLVVASGATLNLAANVNAINTSVQGILNLGNSTNTINGNLSGSGSAIINLGSGDHYVSNNFATFAGDIIKLNVLEAPTVGKITANGSASVDSGTKLAINISPFSKNHIIDGTSYQIVSGNSGSDINAITNDKISINGINSNKMGSLTFTTMESSDNASLILIAHKNLLLNSYIDPSLKSVSNAISASGSSATGNLLLLQQYLDSDIVSSAQKSDALKSVTPQVDNSSNSFTVTSASVGAAEDRLQFLQTGSGISSGDIARNSGIWMQGFGTNAKQDVSSQTVGYNANSLGTAVGADSEFFGDTHIGVSLSYARSNIKSKIPSKNINIDTYQVNLYGNKNYEKFFIDAIIGFAWNEYRSKRVIPVVEATANGKYSGQTYLAKFEIGSVQKFHHNFSVVPFLSTTAAQNNVGSYQENGAGTLDLNIANNKNEFFEVRAGVGFSYNAVASEQTHINLRAKTSYGYDFYRNKQTADSNFVGQTATFQSSTTNLYQGSTKVGFGVDIIKTNGISLATDYSFESRRGYQAHFGMLRLRYNY